MAEWFIISGQLGHSLSPWIGKHADRIGVDVRFGNSSADRLEICVDGPPALLDAMEMGCLLGPIDIWVDDIQRKPFAGLHESS